MCRGRRDDGEGGATDTMPPSGHSNTVKTFTNVRLRDCQWIVSLAKQPQLAVDTPSRLPCVARQSQARRPLTRAGRLATRAPGHRRYPCPCHCLRRCGCRARWGVGAVARCVVGRRDAERESRVLMSVGRVNRPHPRASHISERDEARDHTRGVVAPADC